MRSIFNTYRHASKHLIITGCTFSSIIATVLIGVITGLYRGRWLKVAVDNYCKRASKLTLAVALDSLGSKTTAAVCAGCALFPWLSLSLLRPVWTETNRDSMVAGKVAAEWTGPSQLELKPTDGVACRHSVVGRGESEHSELISSYRCHLSLRSTA